MCDCDPRTRPRQRRLAWPSTWPKLGSSWWFQENRMDTKHLTPAGGVVAQCSDEESCTVVSCAVCLKEIPADSIKRMESQDYVLYFCGLDCLEAWQKQAAADSKQSG